MLVHASFEHEIRNGVSIFAGWNAPVYHGIDYILVYNVCQTAVPTFFLISGFLFFIKKDYFSISDYKSKLSKRFHSLFIPYVIWNILVLLLYLVVQSFVPSMVTGRNKAIADYSLCDYVMSFWSMSYINEGGVSGPIDSPLWFIRDLMVMAALSPVVYWIIRKTRILLPLLGLIAFVVGFDTKIQGLSTVAICFFSMGAFLAIYKFDFGELSKDFIRFTFPLYAINLLILLSFRDNVPYLCAFNKVIGVMLFVGLAYYLVERKDFRNNIFLTGSTFFIFASHNEVLKVFVRLTSKTGIHSDLFYCTAYFVCPLVTLSVLLAIYWIIKKYTPSIAALLSGGR